jgi:hypothetical protein
VQISNISLLNAPGIGKLTTSQVGTSLCLNSNNDIVKNVPVHLFITADANSSMNICSFTYNPSTTPPKWETRNNLITQTQTNLILINPTPPINSSLLWGRWVDYRNWSSTTKWVHTNQTTVDTATNGGSLSSTIKTGLIKFPVPGFYYIYVTIPSMTGCELFLVKNFNKNTNEFKNDASNHNILSRIFLSTGYDMTSCITYIENNWDSTEPDTISIILINNTGSDKSMVVPFILTITKLY